MYLYLIEVYTDTENWKLEEFDKDKFLVVAENDAGAEDIAKEKVKERNFDYYEIERIEKVNGYKVILKAEKYYWKTK